MTLYNAGDSAVYAEQEKRMQKDDYLHGKEGKF